MDFKDQLKSSVDLVNVVGEYVRLKKSGPQRYMGLCPFHNEKTPSFTVHAARQFYKCFGCGEGGDVFNFVQKIEGISFYEALKLLAERHGVPMPKRTLVADEDSKLREAVFRMHELALASFRGSLGGPPGEEARAYLARRGVADATIVRFELGYSERFGRTFSRLFEQHGFTPAQMEQSGLVRRRDDGSFYDYFRNRLMFPIHGETGKVIGFGGRALAAEKQRIGVIASGGLSHDPGELRHGIIDSSFDELFMQRMERGDAAGLRGYSNADFAAAGAGAFELLAWIALQGALDGARGHKLAYEAVVPWATGMGLMEFDVA